MDDVKDKMKGLIKKVNNPFSSSSSSSGKFKGQGRVLGSVSTPTNSSIPTHSLPPPHRNLNSNPKPSSSPSNSNQTATNKSPSNEFDPFDSLITSGKRTQNGNSLNLFLCPVCQNPFQSEEQVSEHIDKCVGNVAADDETGISDLQQQDDDGVVKLGLRNELEECIGRFVSGGALKGSIEIVVKLLKNIVREPENLKFRRIRMVNPKIREFIGEVVGGIELLEFVGFKLKEEGDEMWAVMDDCLEERVVLIKEAIKLLEPSDVEVLPSTTTAAPAKEIAQPVEPQKIDRQVRVFFNAPESVTTKVDLPDSYYNLSVNELKKEADLRKKKIAESQLLIPKSYKEKKAKDARKRYKTSVIRIQFPDEVVLQGVFLPWEPTTALYEFVSSSLKEPCLEFELWRPAVLKPRLIPRFPDARERTPTLDEEDLVPSAIVKFKPIETDSVVFTGLSNELLEISEPLN